MLIKLEQEIIRRGAGAGGRGEKEVTYNQPESALPGGE